MTLESARVRLLALLYFINARKYYDAGGKKRGAHRSQLFLTGDDCCGFGCARQYAAEKLEHRKAKS